MRTLLVLALLTSSANAAIITRLGEPSVLSVITTDYGTRTTTDPPRNIGGRGTDRYSDNFYGIGRDGSTLGAQQFYLRGNYWDAAADWLYAEFDQTLSNGVQSMRMEVDIPLVLRQHADVNWLTYNDEYGIWTLDGAPLPTRTTRMTNGTYTLRFRGTTTNGTGRMDAKIGASFASVPEPSALLLLVPGLVVYLYFQARKHPQP